MKIHFGNPRQPESIQEAIGLYKPSEFHSVTRSTIPMLSLLAHDQPTFQGIVGKMEIPADHDTYLEYTVSPKIGRGKASHTDVMLVGDDRSLAIEAKWTEGMYPTVGKWLSQADNRKNREDVLTGWLNGLADHIGQSFDWRDFDQAVYQMVHRAASAVSAERNPAVGYFLFKMTGNKKGASTQAVTDQLQSLWSLLEKPDVLPFYVVEIRIEGTAIYHDLQNAAGKLKKKQIAEKVRSALQSDEPLFHFTPQPVVRIGSEK